MLQERKVKKLLLLLFMCSVMVSCSKDDDVKEIDTEYPEVDVSATEAFPKQCSEFTRGTTVTTKILVSDNRELGSVSLDIHHNFDHHTHSTEVEECNLDPRKTPVKPFLLIKSIPIPEGNKTYTVTSEIDIPQDVDPGDYHFMIRVTDKEGWQTLKGLSIKIK